MTRPVASSRRRWRRRIARVCGRHQPGPRHPRALAHSTSISPRPSVSRHVAGAGPGLRRSRGDRRGAFIRTLLISRQRETWAVLSQQPRDIRLVVSLGRVPSPGVVLHACCSISGDLRRPRTSCAQACDHRQPQLRGACPAGAAVLAMRRGADDAARDHLARAREIRPHLESDRSAWRADLHGRDATRRRTIQPERSSSSSASCPSTPSTLACSMS